MTSAGCYGSFLAHDAKSDTCKGCSLFGNCAEAVKGVMPKVIKVLDMFDDGTGRTMAWGWLTPYQKRKRREQEKKAAMSIAEELTLGDEATALRATMDPRAFPHFDRLMQQRTDPRRAELDDIAAASPAMGAVINALRKSPQTIDGIASCIAAETDLSAATAKRDAFALTTLLTSCDRAERDGPTVRLI